MFNGNLKSFGEVLLLVLFSAVVATVIVSAFSCLLTKEEPTPCVQCCPRSEFNGQFVIDGLIYKCECVIQNNDYQCSCELVIIDTDITIFQKDGKFQDQEQQHEYENRK